MRKVCLVTSSRADYGLLYWLAKEIKADPALKLQLIVTGMHLLREYGSTYRAIQKDGFKIDRKVDLKLSKDSPSHIAQAIGTAVLGFSNAFHQLNPDLLVILGDRFEMFAAAAASVPFRIPIAHVHGGETTEGAMDEAFRHSITKMSHYHFVAADLYRTRVIQLGEDPDRVFCVGAPGLDVIEKLKLLSREELLKNLGFPAKCEYFLLTFHPATLEKNSAKQQTSELLRALDEFPNYQLIITYPNIDTEGRQILNLLKLYVRKHPSRAILVNTLGQLRYLSALKYAAAIIGNSSSAIIEAPSFRTPVVNMGDRQKGRLMAANVISCLPKKNEIIHSIQKALSQSFRGSLEELTNPYGSGDASRKIKNLIKKLPLNESILKKKFFDLNPASQALERETCAL